MIRTSLILLVLSYCSLSSHANAWIVWSEGGGQWLQSHKPEVLEEDRQDQGEATREPQEDAERGEERRDESLAPEETLTE